jgi:hypothetical protein
MKLLQLGNEDINEVMFSAENSQFVAEALGFPAIRIPGQAQRTKQFQEIKILLVTQPVPLGLGQDGQPETYPSVDIEPDIDDDGDHIDVLKDYLVEMGEYLKVTNPAGYENCMAHLRLHVQNQEMQQMQEMMQDRALMGEGQPSENQPVKE